MAVLASGRGAGRRLITGPGAGEDRTG